MKITKTQVLQVIIGSLAGLVGAVAGFVITAPMGAYSDIHIGLVRGYEVTGGIGGSLGMWIGVALGVLVVAKFSKVPGLLSYGLLYRLLHSAALASVGAVLMCIGVLWLVPILGTPLMVLLTALLATVGWHLRSVKMVDKR